MRFQAHVVVPIVIDGEHLLTLFTGQFFLNDDIPDIKVIFMSGYTEDLLGIQEIEEKRAEFLQKPINSDELILRVRKTMGS